MTPRPIHRWPSFWLGIFILTFLSWAWVRSQSHRDCVRYNSGHAGTWYDIECSSGRIWCGKTTDLIPRPPLTEFIFAENPDPHWFPPHFHHKTKTTRTPGGTIIHTDTSIAYWFLIVLFLVAWAAFLTWRWRRIQTLTKPQLPP